MSTHRHFFLTSAKASFLAIFFGLVTIGSIGSVLSAINSALMANFNKQFDEGIISLLSVSNIKAADASANNYWVYIQLENKYSINKQNNVGRAKKGDIIAITQANSQHNPTPTEQNKWAIIKVNGLTEEERNKYTQTWENEVIVDNNQLRIANQANSILAYRQYKVDVDYLGLTPGKNSQIKTSQFLKDKIKAKTQNDLIAYERARKFYVLKTAPRRLAVKIKNFIIPPSVAVTEEISCVNGSSNAACNGVEDYNTLTLWESDTDNDLTASQVIALAYCHDDDGVLYETPQIAGATTNSTYYRKITAPYSERHNGIVDNSTSPIGVTVDGGTTINSVIKIDEGYGQIEYMRVRNGNISNGKALIFGNNTAGHIFRNNIVHNPAICGGASCSGIYNGNSTILASIYNNIVANIANTSSTIVRGIWALKGNVMNNTVYNITDSIGNSAGIGISAGGSNVNNIVTNCTTEPFEGSINYNASTDYNACDTASCTSMASIHDSTGLSAPNLFTSLTFGSEDLHLKAGSPLIDIGSDLSINFITDIDGGTRTGSWDIGADEYNSSGDGADDEGGGIIPPDSGFSDCSDGTLNGECAGTKPLYCNNGSLENNCSVCGCNSGYNCSEDGTCIVLTPTCVDADSDGYGVTGSGSCTYSSTDCNDSNANIHPNATEACNSLDDDCDGGIDENCVSGGNNSHPRIFLNNEIIATLITRKNANTIQWQRLKNWADSTKPIGTKNPTDTHAGATQMALVYLVTGDTRYADAAIYWMDQIKTINVNINSIASNLTDFSRAYDWLYNYLTLAQREEYQAKIVEWANLLHNDDYIAGYYAYSFGNYSQRFMTAEAMAGYALLGDNDNAQSYIDSALANWNLINAAFHLSCGDGASFQGEDYGNSSYFPYTVQFLEMMTFVTGRDYYAGTIFENRLKFLIHNLWPGLENNTPATKNYRNGDYTDWRMRYSSIRLQMLILGNKYYNTYGKYAYWILNNNDDLNTGSRDFMYSDRDLDFIFYDPNKIGTNISELPLYYYANNIDGVGITIMRSDWGDNQTYIGYTCGNWIGGGHSDLDQGSFQIYSHKRELAISSGTYDGLGTGIAMRGYVGRTIAQNSLLILDPNEHWDNSLRSCNSYSVDGGQRDFSGIANTPDGSMDCPQMVKRAEIWEAYRPRMEICDYTGFKNSNDFTYLNSNLTNAYNNINFQSDPNCPAAPKNIAKVSKVTRQLVYLRPINDGNEYVVIFDDITSTDASYKKTWLWHTLEQPVLNGNEAVIEGDSIVGISQSTNSNLVYAIEGDQKMFSKTLLPVNSVITRIGGIAGSTHTATDYDQWVGIPGVSGENYYLYTSPYGKYRVEVSPATPSLQDNFLHVLYPTSSSTASMPATTLITSSDNKMKGALIADPVNPRIAMFSIDGSGQNNVTYNATYASNLTGKHLIANMTPGIYDVYKNSSKILSNLTVGSDGVLTFDSLGGSTFQAVMTGETPPTPACTDGAQITSTCLCGGGSYGSGYCCSGVYQSVACAPTCTPPQILCSNSCYTPVCTQNSDCNDNNSYTTDTCNNPNACNASCSNISDDLVITFGGTSNITTTSAMVSWTTTLPANSIVEYGPTNAYGSNFIDDTQNTIHSLLLTGLTPGTTYHFRVSSVSSLNGDSAVGIDRTLTTATPVCTNGQTQSCGPNTDIGICEYGSQTCSSNAWGICLGSVMPTDEICGNGLDDDCDSSVDEGCAPNTCSDTTSYSQCSTSKPKYCNNGTLENKCSQCGCPSGQTCETNGSCQAPASNAPGGGGGGGGSASDQVNEGQLGTFTATKDVAINIANNRSFTNEDNETASSTPTSLHWLNSLNHSFSLLLAHPAQANLDNTSYNFWHDLAFWSNIFSIISLVSTGILVVFLFFLLFSIVLFIHHAKEKFGHYPNFKLILIFIFRHPFYSLECLPKNNKIINVKECPVDRYHYWTSQAASIGFYGSLAAILVKLAVIMLLLNVFSPAQVLAEAKYDDEGKSVKVGDYLTYRLVVSGDKGSPQTFNDPVPVGLIYEPKSLVVGDEMVTDSCLDDDAGCYDEKTKTVKFTKIPLNTKVYWTGKVDGTKSPVVNVALNNKVNNPVVAQGLSDTPDQAGGTLEENKNQEIKMPQQIEKDNNQTTWLPKRPDKFNLVDEQTALNNVRRFNTLFLKPSELEKVTDGQAITASLYIAYGLPGDTSDQRNRLDNYGNFMKITGRNPVTDNDYEDMWLWSTGQVGKHNFNKIAEAKAFIPFIKVYRRLPQFRNKDRGKADEMAIHMIAYYIKIPQEKRDMAKERAALKTFVDVFKRLPKSGDDWNIVRMIGYSGASR